VKITAIDDGLDLAISTGPRSPGRHISEIYGDLFSDLEPDRYKRDSPPNMLKMALGLAWETHLEKMLLHHGVLAYRPAECLSPEGIAYSPDLVIVNGEDRLGEIKLTWLSCRLPITDPKFDKWFVQMKAYCRWTEIPRCRLYATFINGNYRDNREPTLKVYDFEFTAQELHENMAMLKSHGQHKGLWPEDSDG
jgi:hypothetical protein